MIYSNVNYCEQCLVQSFLFMFCHVQRYQGILKFCPSAIKIVTSCIKSIVCTRILIGIQLLKFKRLFGLVLAYETYFLNIICDDIFMQKESNILRFGLKTNE